MTKKTSIEEQLQKALAAQGAALSALSRQKRMDIAAWQPVCKAIGHVSAALQMLKQENPRP